VPSGDDDIGIGGRVRAARRRLGWSREALAFHAGISWSAISQLEGGRRRNLRPGTLAALAGALGVTVDYLVSGSAFASSMLEHSALVYESEAEFVETAAPFLAEALERSEAALVVAGAGRIELLREALGANQRHVEFAERATWGDGPVEVLSGFRAFVTSRVEAGTPWVRILAEPTEEGRRAFEHRSLARYESLLNLAFSATPLTALCAYDARTLDETAMTQLNLTHPHTVVRAGLVRSTDFVDPIQFVSAREPAPDEGR